MLRASLRGLLQRKLRLALALFAIILSTGFLSASFVLTDTFEAKINTLFATINTGVDVQVSAVEDTSGSGAQPPMLSKADVDRIATVPGIARVAGDVITEGVLPFDKKTGKALHPQGPGLAIGAPADSSLSLLQLSSGRLPTTSTEVAVTRYTAEQAGGLAVGDTVKVFLPNAHETKQFTVVGIMVYPGNRGTLGGELMTIFDEATAQQLFYGKTGVYAGAEVKAADGVDQATLAERVQAVLPAGFEAKTRDQANKDSAAGVASFLDAVRIFFGVFVGIAALVGIFLIYNTFNIIVAQRARELALLRALGAGWRQVTGSVLLEAVIVGFVGATLGLAAGIGLGLAGLWAITNLLGAQLPEGGFSVGLGAIIGSYALGVIVTVLAGFIPAVRASAVSPIAAMREVIRPDKSLKAISIIGGALLLPGAGLVGLALTGIGGATLPVLGLGVLLAFFGVALLSPLLARPVGGLIGRLIAYGPAGGLGRRNALRNPRRTAVTAAALMIGITLVTSVSVLTESFKTSISESLTSDLSADVIVTTQFTSAPTGKEGFDPAKMDEVAKIPGVAHASAFFLSLATVAGQPSAVGAGDVDQALAIIHLKTNSGELRKLNAHELIVDSGTAASNGWKVGDTVKISLAKGGEQDYTVVGIYQAIPATSGVLLGLPAVDDFAGKLAYQGLVDVADGQDIGAVQQQVERIMADEPQVSVTSQEGYAAQINAQLDFVLYVFLGLLGLALLIAFLGIINTLLLSIHERTRELGLVRAVGLNRSGLIRMVGVESVVIAVFGCLLGIALGVSLGTAGVQALISREIISTVAIPWGWLAVYVSGAIAAGVLAAVIPAWRASRLNVLDAIAYE